MEARLRLDPYLTLVVRPPTLLQLGASATGSPVLRPPPWLAPDSVAALLRWFQRYRTLAELRRRASDTGLTDDDTAELLDTLRLHGLVHVEPEPNRLHVYLHGRGQVADALLGEVGALDGVRVSAGAARSWNPAGRDIDLVLLTDTLAPDPVLQRRLMTERTPHLPVVVRDGIGVVGPLVLPGATPCLRCLDHVRADADPGWPSVACQLFGRAGRASPQVLRITTSLAALQVEAMRTDALNADAARGDGPEALGCSLEVEGCGVAVRRWAMHPACGCGGAIAGRGAPVAADQSG